MVIKKFLPLIMLSLTLTGCSNAEQDSDDSVTKHGVEAQKSLISLLSSYQTNDVGKTRNNSTPTIVIDECENKSYTVNKGSSSLTRSSDNISDSTEIVLSYIKFHQDTVHGYAIASNDPRLNRVYAFVESGDFVDTTKIEPLKWAIERIPLIAESDIQSYYLNSETASTQSYVNTGNIVNTSWHQYAPFNNYAPVCSSSPDGHMPIGCVPMATAQLIAKCQHFKGTYLGNRDIDFDKLTSVSQITKTSSLASQAATFLYEVAMYCQVDFGCDGSGTQLKDAFQYLKDIGYTGYFKEGGLDAVAVYKYLLQGIPHMSAGKRSRGTGHAWLITGIRGNYDGSNFSSYETWCNWGWNSSNGWFADYRIANSTNAYTSNNKQVYITGY